MVYLDPDAAASLKLLNPELGDQFRITRRREPGKRIWWEIERTARQPVGSPEPMESLGDLPENPKIAARAPTPPVVRDLPPRIPAQTAQSAPPLARGTGTNGPAPEPVQRIQPRLAALKPTYREALRECVQMVQDVLAETGEQWSDQSRQAMVSTLMIQAGREGAIRFGCAGKVA